MKLIRTALLLLLASTCTQARVVQLRIERREVVLQGSPFGSAGPYEKLVGKVEFALDPALPQNAGIVDLGLAPRNANGEVEFSADFYLLKPVDPARGNRRLLYEVCNRGSKSMLRVFQQAQSSTDPTTAAQYGDGALMKQGYSLLWMGWQWDVPDGQLRMEMPIASDRGKSITGLVRANIILNSPADTALLADRNHKAYAPIDPAAPDNVMTVRNYPLDPPQQIPHKRWHFVDGSHVALEGGFEPGRIYDVVYRARDPKVIGVDLAGTRDLISFLKYTKDDTNPARIQFAYGWGVSQSGRFLRHFLYQGFNEDEHGRMVFDGIIDEVGGAGRGSFNHRFAQASRDAEEHLNIFYPVDMFPFTDSPETDPETGQTDSLLSTVQARYVAPKIFHILSNSEYFNRAGSLIHTDPAGKFDIEPPPDSRIYFVSSGPHYAAHFPPANTMGDDLVGQALLNPLDRSPIVRALLVRMDAWVTASVAPPPSRFPHLSDGTLTAPDKAGWPTIPGFHLPPPMLIAYRIDFGPAWNRGIISFEPPRVGHPFVEYVPAVDADGNSRAGIRLPQVEVPVGTFAGWNYRSPATGLPDQLAGEAGSFYPFPRTRAQRESTGDSRLSLEERYVSREHYSARITLVAHRLVDAGFLLPQDVQGVLDNSLALYDWACSSRKSETATGK